MPVSGSNPGRSPSGCPSRRQIERSLDGAPAGAEVVPIEAHLESCPRCQRLAAEIEALDAALAAGLLAEQPGCGRVPPSLRRRLVALAERERAVRLAGAGPQRRRATGSSRRLRRIAAPAAPGTSGRLARGAVLGRLRATARRRALLPLGIATAAAVLLVLLAGLRLLGPGRAGERPSGAELARTGPGASGLPPSAGGGQAAAPVARRDEAELQQPGGAGALARAPLSPEGVQPAATAGATAGGAVAAAGTAPPVADGAAAATGGGQAVRPAAAAQGQLTAAVRRSAAGPGLVLPGEQGPEPSGPAALAGSGERGPRGELAGAALGPADERLRPVRLAHHGGTLFVHRAEAAAPPLRLAGRNAGVRPEERLVAGAGGGWFALGGVEVALDQGARVWLGHERATAALLLGLEAGAAALEVVADRLDGGVVLVLPQGRVRVEAGRVGATAGPVSSRLVVLSGRTVLQEPGQPEREIAAGREVAFADGGSEPLVRRPGEAAGWQRLVERLLPRPLAVLHADFELEAEGFAGRLVADGYRGRGLELWPLMAAPSEPAGHTPALGTAVERPAGLFTARAGTELRLALRLQGSAHARLRVRAYNASAGAFYECWPGPLPGGRWAVVAVPVDALLPAPASGARALQPEDVFTRLEVALLEAGAGARAVLDEVWVIARP
ncbi:MAG: hypothetical protein KatS3mg102_1230 [Planctomycetota bacterium]|nr:MAG: hypothetical protein KatS3mg102_1230 [Planctomycetota bacterium]